MFKPSAAFSTSLACWSWWASPNEPLRGHLSDLQLNTHSHCGIITLYLTTIAISTQYKDHSKCVFFNWVTDSCIIYLISLYGDGKTAARNGLDWRMRAHTESTSALCDKNSPKPVGSQLCQVLWTTAPPLRRGNGLWDHNRNKTSSCFTCLAIIQSTRSCLMTWIYRKIKYQLLKTYIPD